MVPVEGEDWIVVVAAANGKGTGFGYFFRYISEDLTDYNSGEALHVGMFGDFGVCQGEWSTLGEVPNFKLRLWPVTPLVAVDHEAGLAFVRTYDPVTLSTVGEEKISSSSSLIEKLPRDGFPGSRVLQKRLARKKNRTQ